MNYYWFEVSVKGVVLEDGREKKVTRKYLVQSAGVSEAERYALEEYVPLFAGDAEVVSVVQKPIAEVWNAEESKDYWYRVKVVYTEIDPKNGREKNTSALYMLTADDVRSALGVAEDNMRGSLADWRIADLVETSIIDIHKEDAV